MCLFLCRLSPASFRFLQVFLGSPPPFVRVLFLPARSGFLPAAFRVLTFPLLVFVFRVCHEEPPLPVSRILSYNYVPVGKKSQTVLMSWHNYDHGRCSIARFQPVHRRWFFSLWS